MSTDIHAEVAKISASLKTLQKSLGRLSRDVKFLKYHSSLFDDNIVRKRGNGFDKPTMVSDTLADFLGIDRGNGISRVEVWDRVSKYIKDNNLKDPSNGRNIIPDEKFRALLVESEPAEPLTWFTFQKHIRHHYLSNSEG
jgi:upstream activation factor subunit UAF30